MMKDEVRPSLSVAGKEMEAGASEIALRRWQVRGKVTWPVAQLHIRQIFENTARNPLEVVYTFPLSSDQILEAFDVFLSGKRITSRVVKREDARKEYETYLEQGDFAVHLKQHRSNVFSLSIGNLAPGECVLVDFHLSQVLEIQHGEILLRTPTVVGPRYIPGEPLDVGEGLGWAFPTTQVPDADEITPPFTFDPTPYSVQAYFEISRDLPVESIESPSHPFRIQLASDHSYHAFMGDELKANKDIVLKIKVKPVQESTYSILTYDDTSILATTLTPETRTQRQKRPQDLVFLIDISGSMAGVKLKTTRKAVQLCLRKLSAADRFQLIAFESDLHPWKREWVPVTDKTIQMADRWLNGLESLGGTELLPAVHLALRQFRDPDTHREPVIVLLTDGMVGNEWEIARTIKKSNFKGRMILFGIDTVVNQELFQAIHRVVPVMARYIYPGEDIRRVVNMQFQNLGVSWVRQMAMEVSGKAIQLTGWLPMLPFPLAEDTTRLLFFEINGETPRIDALLLYTENGETLRIPVQKQHLTDAVHNSLLKFWGKQLLENRASPESEDLAVSPAFLEQLALDLQLPSPYTDWIALWERDEKIQEISRVQVVPVDFPDMWCEDKFYSSADVLFDLDQTCRFQPVVYHYQNETPRDVVCDMFLYQKMDGRFSFSHPRNSVWESLIVAGWLLAQMEADEQSLQGFESNLKKLMAFLIQKQSRFTKDQRRIWNYILRRYDSLLRRLVGQAIEKWILAAKAAEEEQSETFGFVFKTVLNAAEDIKDLTAEVRQNLRSKIIY
ncbi:MAG: VWA domain-containing protein [Calditrichaeota bacterium]|nr:VWA domain-containing protein [Calditrichota bacterium]